MSEVKVESKMEMENIASINNKVPDGSEFHRGGHRGNFGRGRGGFNFGRGGRMHARGGMHMNQPQEQHMPGQQGGQFRGGRDGKDLGRRGLGRGGGYGGGANTGYNVRFDRMMEKLSSMLGKSSYEVPTIDTTEKPFPGRSRLYVGNVAPGTKEDEIKEMMKPFGEIRELFYNNEKNFAFLRLETRALAEKAKRELDGQINNGRPLRVRFAPHQGAVKISNLGPWVTNELLHYAFSIFGDIERCVVHVDDRGRPKGEGYIEFEKKHQALEAVKRCAEGCYFLTASLRPVIAEISEANDDEDGFFEKNLLKRSQEYLIEREVSPRFAAPATFEFDFGQKWKSLHEVKRQRLEALEREMKLEEEKLVAQMEFAKYEHETEQLRNKLQEREAMRDMQKNQFEESERRMGEMMRLEQERRQRDEGRLGGVHPQGPAGGGDLRNNPLLETSPLFTKAKELNMADPGKASEDGKFPVSTSQPISGGSGLIGDSPKSLMSQSIPLNSGFGGMQQDPHFGPDFGGDGRAFGGDGRAFGGYGGYPGAYGAGPMRGWHDNDMKRRKY